MKKILIISAVFSPEPVVSASISMDIAQDLAKTDEVTVISPRPTRPLNFKFEKDGHLTRDYQFRHIVADSFTYPKSKLYGRMKESYSFGKWCESYINTHSNEIDIIYMNAWPLFSQLFISKAAEQNQIPLITHVQDIYPESIINKLPAFKSLFFKMLLPIDKKILNRSKKILTISQNMKRQLMESRGLKDDKFEIITNWQNEESFIEFHKKKNKTERSKREVFVFMYLGNNGPVAGVEFLIEAFCRAGLPNSKLIIAGSGSKTEDCVNLVKRLDATNVEFLQVPDGKVPEIQDLADVMLLPVKKNGAYSSIPSKLPAYMFSAKPIIGSLDVDSDTAKAIINADAGIVVEPENEEKLISAMKNLLNWSADTIEEKGENGFHYALNNFSRNANLNKIVSILRG